MYYLIAFYQRNVELWCHAKSFPNAPRTKVFQTFMTAFAKLWTLPSEYMFCFIGSEQCVKIILSCKNGGLFSSLFKKIIPNNTTPTFQERAGVT